MWKKGINFTKWRRGFFLMQKLVNAARLFYTMQCASVSVPCQWTDIPVCCGWCQWACLTRKVSSVHVEVLALFPDCNILGVVVAAGRRPDYRRLCPAAVLVVAHQCWRLPHSRMKHQAAGCSDSPARDPTAFPCSIPPRVDRCWRRSSRCGTTRF